MGSFDPLYLLLMSFHPYNSLSSQRMLKSDCNNLAHKIQREINLPSTVAVAGGAEQSPELGDATQVTGTAHGSAPGAEQGVEQEFGDCKVWEFGFWGSKGVGRHRLSQHWWSPSCSPCRVGVSADTSSQRECVQGLLLQSSGVQTQI